MSVSSCGALNLEFQWMFLGRNPESSTAFASFGVTSAGHSLGTQGNRPEIAAGHYNVYVVAKVF